LLCQPSVGAAATAEVNAGRKQMLEDLGHRFREQAVNHQKKQQATRSTTSGEIKPLKY